MDVSFIAHGMPQLRTPAGDVIIETEQVKAETAEFASKLKHLRIVYLEYLEVLRFMINPVI